MRLLFKATRRRPRKLRTRRYSTDPLDLVMMVYHERYHADPQKADAIIKEYKHAVREVDQRIKKEGL